MINKAICIGNVGADPKINATQDGREIASFSLATSERWKDKNTGEKKERTDWHRVVVFSEGLVGVVKSYVKKGSKIYVEGKMQTRKWQDQSGTDRYVTEIVLSGFGGSIVLLDKKEGSGVPPAQSESEYSRPDYGGHPDAPQANDLNDEIPFAPDRS